MSLWDWCIDSDDEKIEEVFIGDTPVIKYSPRDYNLHNKGVVPNTSSSPKPTPLSGKSPPITTSKPSTPAPTTASDKSNTIVSANNNKSSTSNPTANNTKPNNPTTNNKAKIHNQTQQQTNQKHTL
jgi:hypothetical protein